MMSGICDTCQRQKRIGCGLAMDGLESCDMHESESRYQQLFGTPDKAAVFFAFACFQGGGSACKYYCPVYKDCDGNLHKTESFVLVRAKIAEWLRGDA